MTAVSSFDTLPLGPELLQGLRKRGFRTPTPIQELVIPEVAKGGDLIVQAQTGSGKTLAFGLPLLDQVPVDEKAPTTLVVAPTRELAKQIKTELASVLATLPRLVVAASGGEGLEKQIKALERGAHLVVGTPGRLNDLVKRGALNLKHVRTLVLDEADEILAKGFGEELNQLVERMPAQRQTLLFSATMPAAVQRLADATLRKPQRLKVKEAPTTPLEIDHFALEVTDETRLGALMAWLEAERPFMAMVFCRTRTETEWLAEQLSDKGFENEYLSGELSQNKRSQILERFRSGDLPLLICTDLAARGLDVAGVTHVVHYTVPTTLETYIHRSGRTGRAGRKGVALTLVAPQERRNLHAIQKTVELKGWHGLKVEGLPRIKGPQASTARRSPSKAEPTRGRAGTKRR